MYSDFVLSMRKIQIKSSNLFYVDIFYSMLILYDLINLATNQNHERIALCRSQSIGKYTSFYKRITSFLSMWREMSVKMCSCVDQKNKLR